LKIGLYTEEDNLISSPLQGIFINFDALL